MELFNRLLAAIPEQHGTAPPSDQQLADSHPHNCLCSHCISMEPPESTEQADQSNQLFEESILNENHD